MLLSLGDLSVVVALVDSFSELSQSLTESITSGFLNSDFSGGTGY